MCVCWTSNNINTSAENLSVNMVSCKSIKIGCDDAMKVQKLLHCQMLLLLIEFKMIINNIGQHFLQAFHFAIRAVWTSGYKKHFRVLDVGTTRSYQRSQEQRTVHPFYKLQSTKIQKNKLQNLKLHLIFTVFSSFLP